ncbi:MAG: DUF2076 family protein [Nocardiopsaceae bacterium]|nr:DUF2076 family protein [Nocardiopsaceae bacterium]
MNQQDQQAIDDLFQHLYRTSAQAGPPDSAAEDRVQQHIRQGPPGLVYQMAQTLVGQQAALRQMRSQLADCEQQLRQGGYAGQQAYGGYGQPYQQRAGWGSGGQGFLAGAGQIALGVGGGILAAEALSNLFGGGGLFGDDQGYDDRGDYDRGDSDDRQDDGDQNDGGQDEGGQYDTAQYDTDGGYDDGGFDGGGFDGGGDF